MGMVPNLVTGVWVGGEDRSVHFKDIAFGQGATMALPIWAMYMRDAYAIPELGISMEDFEPPEILTIPIDCQQEAVLDDLHQEAKKDDLEGLGF